MSSKVTVAAGLIVFALVLLGLFAAIMPTGSSNDSGVIVALVGVGIAFLALVIPAIRAASAQPGSATVWFRNVPALGGTCWTGIAVLLALVTLLVHPLSWQVLAFVHGAAGASWIFLSLSAASAGAAARTDETLRSGANARFDRAKLVARDLGEAFAGKPQQARVQKLVTAVTYAPRSRFGRDELADELVADLEALVKGVAVGSSVELDGLLTGAERRLREMGIGTY